VDPATFPSNPFALDATLEPWQVEAADAWVSGDGVGPFRGTLEIFTGGGKSLIALECMRRAAESAPSLRVAIVVPTVALVRQWRRVITSRTSLADAEIGEFHSGRKGDLVRYRVLIAVLNSAAIHLPDMVGTVRDPVMLVVDESHRAGAPQFSRVLQTAAQFRLGLSATAERDDVDEDGTPIDYDEHVLGRLLGGIVHKFDLRAARRIGWLPEFTVTHHAVHLLQDEQRRYDEISRTIDDLADQLSAAGVDAASARVVATKNGETAQLARGYVGAVSLRKDLLYRASERTRVTERIVRDLRNRQPSPRILLFHERIAEATVLFKGLDAASAPGSTVLEHSRLPDSEREAALAAFADGSSPTLVSVKSLIEGIDVPDADVGISVASSTSVRQRVQALGRVLRRRFDGTVKYAEMHLLYVADSVDELIYEKEDWGDLTGQAANHYFEWAPAAENPTALEGPPRTPRPTEEQFWQQVRDTTDPLPLEWPCEWPRSEWRLDGRGTVTDLEGRLVVNPQDAVEAVSLVKPGGGRFRVSHRYRLLVVPETRSGETRAWFVGALSVPFHVAATDPLHDAASPEATSHDQQAADGDRFLGPLDKQGGTFHIRQRAGGTIERRKDGVREFASTEHGSAADDQAANAVNVLNAWRASGETGMKFHINRNGDAYYLAGGEAHFLAHVPEGFAWPEEEQGGSIDT
jgi:superfamily II DNA or RNA helicase